MRSQRFCDFASSEYCEIALLSHSILLLHEVTMILSHTNNLMKIAKNIELLELKSPHIKWNFMQFRDRTTEDNDCTDLIYMFG
jgi:hypothetical protein